MKRTAVALVAVAVVVLSSLAAVEVGVPLGGLTHAQASAAARAAFPGGPMTERWALPGPFMLFRGGSTDAISPGTRWVWAVNFRGTFRGSCGPPTIDVEPAVCQAGHTAMVVVDYVSGEFIQAEVGP